MWEEEVSGSFWVVLSTRTWLTAQVRESIWGFVELPKVTYDHSIKEWENNQSVGEGTHWNPVRQP